MSTDAQKPIVVWYPPNCVWATAIRWDGDLSVLKEFCGNKGAPFSLQHLPMLEILQHVSLYADINQSSETTQIAMVGDWIVRFEGRHLHGETKFVWYQTLNDQEFAKQFQIENATPLYGSKELSSDIVVIRSLLESNRELADTKLGALVENLLNKLEQNVIGKLDGT